MKIVQKTFLFCLSGLLTLQAAYAACICAELHCGFFYNPLGIDSASARLDWTLENNDVSASELTQSACHNTTATVDIPAAKKDSLTENVIHIVESREIAFWDFQDSHAFYEVGSGGCTFKAEKPSTEIL